MTIAFAQSTVFTDSSSTNISLFGMSGRYLIMVLTDLVIEVTAIWNLASFVGHASSGKALWELENYLPCQIFTKGIHLQTKLSFSFPRGPG